MAVEAAAAGKVSVASLWLIMSAWTWTWLPSTASALESFSKEPLRVLPEFISPAESQQLWMLAEQAAWRPSLTAERAFDAFRFGSSAALGPAADKDNDGILTPLEVAKAVRSSLNAPALPAQQVLRWISVVSASSQNISSWMMAALRQEQTFARTTYNFFTNIFEKHPEYFSRFSRQAAVPWDILVRSSSPSAAAMVQRLADEMALPIQAVLSSEDIQVLVYEPGGHYSLHSDTGGPGHRPSTLLIYLEAPFLGGETCLLPQATLRTALELSSVEALGLTAWEYRHRCAERLRQRGAHCIAPVAGTAVLWRNDWPESGRLEVPGAHVACPVRQGRKVVATAWVSDRRCPAGEICSFR